MGGQASGVGIAARAAGQVKDDKPWLVAVPRGLGSAAPDITSHPASNRSAQIMLRRSA